MSASEQRSYMMSFKCPVCRQMLMYVVRTGDTVSLECEVPGPDLFPLLPSEVGGGQLVACRDCLDSVAVLRAIGFGFFDGDALRAAFNLCAIASDVPRTSQAFPDLASFGISDGPLDDILEAWEDFVDRFPRVAADIEADEVVQREQPDSIGFFYAVARAHHLGCLRDVLAVVSERGVATVAARLSSAEFAPAVQSRRTRLRLAWSQPDLESE